jgi:glycosyltransferase involved in cell wall biosynthesis
MTPRVAVLVPVYNEPPGRIAPAIDSALAAGADEVIVIDDGSTEPPVLSPCARVRVYGQRHRGIGAALNLGRSRTRAPLLCWLSCGDTMYAGKIERQVAFIQRTGARAVFHDYLSPDGPVVANPRWATRLWTDNQFSLSTMMLWATAWDAVGGFDDELRWCTDWDFACRVHQRIGWHYLPELLGTAVEHYDGHTQTALRDPRLAALRSQDRARVATRWRHGERNVRRDP